MSKKTKKYKVPTRLLLNGLEIPVIYKTELSTSSDMVEYGEYAEDTKSIHISTTAHKDMASVHRTLLHECMHAILYHTGLSELCKDISDHFEEALVTAFDNAFSDLVVIDNCTWIETARVEFEWREDAQH